MQAFSVSLKVPFPESYRYTLTGAFCFQVSLLLFTVSRPGELVLSQLGGVCEKASELTISKVRILRVMGFNDSFFKLKFFIFDSLEQILQFFQQQYLQMLVHRNH